MVKNELEKDIWPIIFKELSDKKISYAVTPNTYPKKQTWTEHQHHELSIMLEDPDRPPKPGNAALWSYWLTLNLYNDNLRIDTDLYVYLPRSADIQAILAIMDHPNFSTFLSLTLEELPPAGPHYCLRLEGSLSSCKFAPPSSFGPDLKRKIQAINKIAHTIYIIEANPQNKKALNQLTELLLMMQ